MASASPPRSMLLCGRPGAGNTTFARQLAEGVPAVHPGAGEGVTHFGLELHDERAHLRHWVAFVTLRWLDQTWRSCLRLLAPAPRGEPRGQRRYLLCRAVPDL